MRRLRVELVRKREHRAILRLQLFALLGDMLTGFVRTPRERLAFSGVPALELLASLLVALPRLVKEMDLAVKCFQLLPHAGHREGLGGEFIAARLRRPHGC